MYTHTSKSNLIVEKKLDIDFCGSCTMYMSKMELKLT